MASGPAPRHIIELTDQERHLLEAHRVGDNARLAKRAEIVLLCADGHSNSEVARRTSTAVATVRRWRAAFASEGLDGLGDRPRTGRPTADIVLSDEERAELERYVRRRAIEERLATRARTFSRAFVPSRSTETTAPKMMSNSPREESLFVIPLWRCVITQSTVSL